jgi:hypothetical protein
MAALAARHVLTADRADRGRSTAEELRRRGLTRSTVEEVLRPFLAGVFLDPALATSGRLFHLIRRSFLRGGELYYRADVSPLRSPTLLVDGLDELPGRYVCGDHRDTPSVQGALVSGRRAAAAVLADLVA